MAFGYCTVISILGYMIGSVYKRNQLRKNKIIPHNKDDIENNKTFSNEKELWKLNWIPPKHLRIDKYTYRDDNV
jgi:hypothetical protein